MDIGSRLKNLRQECGLTLLAVGKEIGVSKQTLQRYEAGVIKAIPFENIEAMAGIYGVSPSYILGWEKSPAIDISGILPLQPKKVPLLGTIAAGQPLLAEQDYESYVIAGTDVNADFCLKISGDSMINARINDGDIVFIRKQSDVRDGEIAAVLVDNEATLKRVYKSENQVTLMAENSAYHPMVFTGSQLNEIMIIGKAVSFQSNLN